MNKDFRLFQTEFKKWQEKFGLNGYQVYFKYEPITECNADITIHRQDMVAMCRLNKGENSRPSSLSAKHEALHLLVNRLEDLALNRYVRPEEIEEATEELVVKLESLIKG